jgi:predicted phosphodiesterase
MAGIEATGGNTMKKVIMMLLVCLLLSGCEAGLDKQAVGTKGFRFVVMGDNRPWWQGEDIITQNEYFIGNIKRANATNADFVVIVGDLIHGYTDDEVLINEQWDAYDEACKLFKMPYISVVGNHDVWDEQSRDIWRERYGPEYFSWDHKGCHFIALSSEIVGEISMITGEQLEWLKQDLAMAGNARRIFVFLHRPLWAEGDQWNEQVHPLLAKYGVDTVFVGHWHQYMLFPEKDGIRYVITGGAGAETEPYELAGGFFHILDVQVKGSSSSFSVVTEEGRLSPDCVTSDKVKALEESLIVRPLERLPEEGEVEIEMIVSNPTNRRIKAIATIEAGGKDDWYAGRSEVPLEPGESKSFTVKAEVDQNVFPLPKSNLKLVDGQKQLFGWEDFLKQAFIKVIPEVAAEDMLGAVINPGFEDGNTTGWTIWGGELSPSKATAHTGDYSGLVTDRTEAWQGPVRDLIDILKDGHTYQFSVWVKLDNAEDGYVKLTIQQADEKGTHYTAISEANAYNDRWVQLSGTFTPDITGYLEGLNLYVEGPAAGVQFYVDDLQIKWDPVGQ